MESNTRDESRKVLERDVKRSPQRGRPLGIYIHFPWCLSKCPYCDFFSVAAQSRIAHDAYADAIVAEFNRRFRALEPATLTSIYVGGGTPSLWDVEALARVLQHLKTSFTSEVPSVEVTLECNPSSFDATRC